MWSFFISNSLILLKRKLYESAIYCIIERDFFFLNMHRVFKIRDGANYASKYGTYIKFTLYNIPVLNNWSILKYIWEFTYVKLLKSTIFLK